MKAIFDRIKEPTEMQYPSHLRTIGKRDRADPSTCPNGPEIIAYAASIGVKDPFLSDDGVFGWHLNGGGKAKDCMRTPLVWIAAKNLGMTHGGGCGDAIQIRPTAYQKPAA